MHLGYRSSIAPMTIADDDLLDTGLERALDGSVHLQGHQATAAGVEGRGWIRLLVARDPGHPLHVG
jgi:hypothetical protein